MNCAVPSLELRVGSGNNPFPAWRTVEMAEVPAHRLPRVAILIATLLVSNEKDVLLRVDASLPCRFSDHRV